MSQLVADFDTNSLAEDLQTVLTWCPIFFLTELRFKYKLQSKLQKIPWIYTDCNTSPIDRVHTGA